MKKEWSEYRQKLRDITDSVYDYDPSKVVFPKKPKMQTPYEYIQSKYDQNKQD
jgi:hypothetical protein